MAKNTIKIKKYSDVIEEFVANAAITPGHLVEVLSTGKIQSHATASGLTLPMFALEDELQGKGITDAYVANTPVQVWIPYRGDQVYALLKDGENVAVGALLESAGDGTFQALTSGGVALAQACEAIDMSGSAGVDPSGRIIVRIL